MLYFVNFSKMFFYLQVTIRLSYWYVCCTFMVIAGLSLFFYLFCYAKINYNRNINPTYFQYWIQSYIWSHTWIMPGKMRLHIFLQSAYKLLFKIWKFQKTLKKLAKSKLPSLNVYKNQKTPKCVRLWLMICTSSNTIPPCKH